MTGEDDAPEALFKAPPLPELERMVEAILFASAEPMTRPQIEERLPHGADGAAAIESLRKRYEGRGVHLVRIGPAWAFRTAPDLGHLMRRETTWSATLSDLLKAYARVQTKAEYAPLNYDPSSVMSVEAALDRLKKLVGNIPEWSTLAGFLPEGWALEPAKRRTAMASSFTAMLELAKRGEIEIRQESTFAPIFVRDRLKDDK